MKKYKLQASNFNSIDEEEDEADIFAYFAERDKQKGPNGFKPQQNKMMSNEYKGNYHKALTKESKERQ